MYERIMKQKKCSRNTASLFECSLMAGLHSNARRPAYMCRESLSLSRLVLYLTALLVSLAACAFVLQWYGGLMYPDVDDYSFPEMDFPEIAKTSTDCADILGRSKKPSFPYYRNWNFSWGAGQSHNPLKICITTTTSAGLEQILPWIFYHKIIGITQFFLFVEGIAASHNVAMVLESIPDVKLIYRTKELEEQQATSRVWNESRWMEQFLYKPCNNELYVKQNLNMDVAAGMAKEAGMDWIFHIDTDELLHPAGTRNYSIQELLLEVPQNVDAVKMPNYESCVERDDIKEPFTEVSMFKKNIKHILEDMFDKHNEDVARENPRPFLGYENWKSCARVQDGLKPGGGHEWTNDEDDFFHSVFEEAAVLHYTYTKFSDLTSRRNRCRCKATIEDLERCFMLEFDKEAFIIASTLTEEEMLEWYREHVVWFDTELKAKLIRDGLLERIYDPMVIVQGLKESGIFADVIASAWEKQQNQKSSS